MFVIGKASPKEVAEMTDMGFEVEPVDVLHFDQALDPNLDVNESNEDRYDDQGDSLVSIFLDCDIVKECRSIHNEEKSLQLKKLQFELSEARDKKMDEVWENYDLGMEAIGMEFSDLDGWEHTFPSDEYCRNFYATPIDDNDADSTKFHFIIRFKPNSSEVLETVARDEQGNDIASGVEEE